MRWASNNWPKSLEHTHVKEEGFKYQFFRRQLSAWGRFTKTLLSWAKILKFFFAFRRMTLEVTSSSFSSPLKNTNQSLPFWSFNCTIMRFEKIYHAKKKNSRKQGKFKYFTYFRTKYLFINWFRNVVKLI